MPHASRPQGTGLAVGEYARADRGWLESEETLRVALRFLSDCAWGSHALALRALGEDLALCVNKQGYGLTKSLCD